MAKTQLFENARSAIIDGPCGSTNISHPCMEACHCTEPYPRKFKKKSDFDDYPLFYSLNIEDDTVSAEVVVR